MTERTIVGVDFGGSGDDNVVGNTWVTEGKYSGGILTISEPSAVSRNALAQLLDCLPSDAVVALDFPFSVPMEFAQWWLETEELMMPDLWRFADKINLSDFYGLIKRFEKQGGYVQLLRVGDIPCPLALPCLAYKARTLVPMTFHGMRMLHRLWHLERCRIPPLDDDGRTGPTLLETMPGTALQVFQLPRIDSGRRYKGQSPDRKRRRAEILDNLTRASGIRINNASNKFRDVFLDNDDALDSLVAAVVAALWGKDKSLIRIPTNDPVNRLKRQENRKRRASSQAFGMAEETAARLEGWIYAPKPIKK